MSQSLSTDWKRWDEKKRAYVHNHREERINLDMKPTPKSEDQNVWLKQEWAKVLNGVADGTCIRNL